MSDLTQFTSPFGSYELERMPKVGGGRQQSLRAWDAADEYLLNWLKAPENGSNNADNVRRTAIINDSFGALTLALHEWLPINASDSYLAHQALRMNAANNGIALAPQQLQTSLELNAPALNLVIIKIPKTSALLEDQLHRLRPFINASTTVIAASMVKLMHKRTLDIFNDIIGTTTTSLAKKKARLIFCQPSPALLNSHTQSPYPSRYTLENTDWLISNHANVFSRGQLDIGTRLFLKHLPAAKQYRDIVDLGCGNGLLGLTAAQRNPWAHIHFCDESYMALDSAKDNFERIFDDPERASFQADNGLDTMDSNSVDLILNNPPFHQGNVVGDFIAWQMFCDSKRVLKTKGELWVVGNRHMGYHLKLTKLFGNCETVASDRKFVILKAVKRS